MKALTTLAALLFSVTAAQAHSWYSKKVDPVYGQSCCGDFDCSQWVILPGELSAETDGIRVRLTLERTRLINPISQFPIDALVTWDRVQPSEDGNWHPCLMTSFRGGERGGIYCLFMPPNG